jgi:hypothetical protein
VYPPPSQLDLMNTLHSYDQLGRLIFSSRPCLPRGVAARPHDSIQIRPAANLASFGLCFNPASVGLVDIVPVRDGLPETAPVYEYQINEITNERRDGYRPRIQNLDIWTGVGTAWLLLSRLYSREAKRRTVAWQPRGHIGKGRRRRV